MKFGASPPNSNNIIQHYFKGLMNEKIPFLEITPSSKLQNFEVILFHGASPYGEEHPGMINLALALAKSGIKVYMPRLPKLMNLELTKDTIDLISHFYLFITKLSNKKIIPAGISFGGGLLIKAMLQDKIKNKQPKSILTYGTYYSLQTSINFLLTGRIKYKEIDDFVKPNDWGLIVLFHNYLPGIDAGFDTTHLQKILELRVANKIIESDLLVENLCSKGKKILNDIYNSNQTPEIKNLLEKMKLKYKKEMLSISPSEVCDKINFHVFLMHGANDSMVPYTESIKLNNELPQSTIFLSGLYEHSEISGGNSIFSKLKEFYKMSSFFTQFMDYNGN